MKDELGDRMKTYYEDRTRTYLPRRTYVIIRIDGKAFHTYTKGLKRPFDTDLIEDMDKTAAYLAKHIQGAKLAYVQSDEISVVVTDFDKIDTSSWFDGNIQKMASIAASMATTEFNRLRTIRMVKEYRHNNVGYDYNPEVLTEMLETKKPAQFDARVFSIPSRGEVINYLIWRQQDATRNSISAVAQSLYSHKQLNGKKTNEMQELIFQKGQNWNDYPIGQKRGRIALKSFTLKDSTKELYDRAKDKSNWVLRGDDATNTVTNYQLVRSVWTAIDPPIFTQAKEFLLELIPVLE